MRRLIVLLAGAAAVVLSSETAAWAGALGGGYDNLSTGTISAQAGYGGSTPPSDITVAYQPTSSVPDPCQYTWISGTDLAGPSGAPDGTWAYPYASDPPGCAGALLPGQVGPPTAFWVPAAGGGAGAAPAPQQVAAQALSSAQVVGPTFETWPPNGHAEVNWPTWVHIRSGWAPISTSATAGPVTATVTATPTSMTVSSFDSSDGGSSYHRVTVTCPGPGTAYDPSEPYADQHSDCTITWAWPSANYGSGSSYGNYPLTVSVTYSVSWTATGGHGGGGALAPITRSTTVEFRVGEVEALGS